MSHPFDKTASCHCERCTKERARRAAQSAQKQANAREFIARKPVITRKRVASRAEQHARYIDCGPGLWDDRHE